MDYSHVRYDQPGGRLEIRKEAAYVMGDDPEHPKRVVFVTSQTLYDEQSEIIPITNGQTVDLESQPGVAIIREDSAEVRRIPLAEAEARVDDPGPPSPAVWHSNLALLRAQAEREPEE